ncbi:globin domain-containing protein [Kitasatospora sp. NPDC054939]
MKSRRTLLVRTGHGSPGVSAVPGPSDTPGLPDTSGLRLVTPEQAIDPEPAALPPMPPALPAAPPFVPPVPTEPPAVPAPPALFAPPAAPPALPAAAPVAPAPVAPVPVAPVEPLFVRAPGLNWAGEGDQWSRAWALQTLAEQPAVPGPEPEPGLGPGPAPVPGPAAEYAPAPEYASAPEFTGPQADAELPPTARDIELIRANLAVVEPVADRATAHFYALIFLHHPEVRALFPAAMDVQRDRLFRSLLTAARSAHDPDGLRRHLGALGRGHRRYGTLTAHYGPVGACLVQALARYSGTRWDGETELAWRRVYRLVSSIMIEAAEEAARTSPAWWQAEVVAHRLHTPDIAEITVRPDQPYPYRAGQYTGVETPWWPRVWRHYSFAGAPRPDGLLSFQVKAVQAGWVSNALVHRAAPGDVLRLGPAAGAMTVDHAAGTDLLCVGGGTGIAPIAALVEEVAEYGAAGRTVEVFYGARQAAELYRLEALRELARRHPWLSVRPVLSAERPGAGVLGGELPEVLGRFGPWREREAYLGGPAAMVRRSVGVLLRAGVPQERIRHDPVGDLAAG